MSLFAEYNTSDLLWLGDWSLGWIIALLTLGMVILALSAYDLAPLPRRRKWTLLALRATVYTLAVLLLLEPAVDLKNVSKVKNHVVVLLDQSRSMNLKAEDGKTRRYDRATKILQDYDTWKTTNAQDHEFHLMSLGTQLKPTSSKDIPTATLQDDETNISQALDTVKQQFMGKELAGIVLISDGIDTGAIGKRTKTGEALDATSINLLKKLDAPINTISVATSKNLKDLAISRVLHDDFAFVHNKVSIEVEIQAIGIDPTTLDVSLFREGQRIQTKAITLTEEKTRYTVTFELVPRRIGKEIYTVEIPQLKGEALTENNQTSFLLRVIRDKVRVLQVVGRPSWDERFMRRLLKKNPNVDLISFFILRTSGNIQRVPTNEMSLIPFPTRELFEDELGSFDLVIFQNFNFGPYNMRQYLPRIANFVKQGGGFIMIGGDLSFASGGYAQTPIEDILPVVLPPTTNPETVINLDEFRPQLTRAGLQHPITQLAFDPKTNKDIWSKLPAQPGTNVVLGAKPDATVLATHPTLTFRGKPMPVIAISEKEKGRVMALTTDSSWRWGFESAGQDGTLREYQLFWNNTIRWLIKDPELKLVKIELTQDTFTPNQKASVVVRVANPDYSPAQNAKGQLTISYQSIARRDEKQQKKAPETLQTLPFQTDASGKALLDVKLPKAGAYHLVASVKRAGNTLQDRNTLLVVPHVKEYRNIIPREKLLGQMAKVTEGKYQTSSSGKLSRATLKPPKMVRVNKRKVIQLWDSWVVFLFILATLAIEWTCRRRWGRL